MTRRRYYSEQDERPYPSKRRLSPPDELRVLADGPMLEWFFPFAVPGEVRTDQPRRMPYGLVHWFFDADGNQQRDVQTFHWVEDARWAMEHLFRSHDDDCQCIAVFYWGPGMVNREPEADS